jgi:2-dehydro-3-deoxygluconokinase
MKSKPKVVTFGELMMRLSPPSPERFIQAKQFEITYGGAEANVAASLSLFGIESEHITRLPENDFGKAAAAHLQSHGVNTKHIDFGGGRMGVYFLEHGADHRSSRVIYDRSDSAFANVTASQFNWEEILHGANWFHWSGITPAISEGAAATCFDAIRTARRLGIPISADINYRRNLWQYGKSAHEVMPALIAESDIVIGGLPDFENCMAIMASDFTDACKKVQQKFPAIAKIIATERTSIHSSHNKISALLWDKRTLLQSKEYELTHIVDRVGSGDAFVAGLICAWLSHWKDQETLEFAIAACALKHTIPGDVNRVSVEEVEALVKGVHIGKLLR